MQRFNLDKWLQDKSRKVVTRDGRKVRIVCWDAKSSKPIIALVSIRSISQREFHDLTVSYFNDGTYYGGATEAFLDLFFADEEEELTEFEKEIKNWMSEFLLCTDQPIPNKTVKQAAKKVLDLARKEIGDEADKLLFGMFGDGRRYANNDPRLDYVKQGYYLGKRDALKDLPK